MVRNALRCQGIALVVAFLAAGCGSQSGSQPALLEPVDGATESLTKAAGGSNGEADYCAAPVHGCLAGEGDCDADADCAIGLKCGTDNGPQFGMPDGYDVCVAAHCTNGVTDGDETGRDCGGTDCGLCVTCAGVNGDPSFCSSACKCTTGQGDCDGDFQCAAGLTCASDNGPRFGMPEAYDVCVPLHCTNGLQDGGESGLDCGGDCGTCISCNGVPGSFDFCTAACPCATGQGDCDADYQCATGLRCGTDNGPRFGMPDGYDACVAAHCVNGLRDADESAADCGGADCGACPTCTGAPGSIDFCTSACPCTTGQGDCDADFQCATGLTCGSDNGPRFGLPVAYDACVHSHCVNGVRDLDEQGVDCGGPNCGSCLPGDPGQPSATQSIIAVNPASTPADGATPAVVTVTVADAAGVRMREQAVRLSYSGAATVAPSTTTTTEAGIATFSVTAAAPTTGTLTATVNPDAAPVVLNASPTLDFHGLYSVGGTISGLTGSGLVLSTEGQADLSVSSGATSFVFGTAVPTGTSYAVTVKTQPVGRSCQVLDGSGTVQTSNVTRIVVSCVQAQVTATHDATLKAPACTVVGSSCDSSSLLVGRAALGPEANAPNTVNSSCADGSYGTYHVDESLDRLKISTTDGAPFAPGKTVRIEATVWAYTSYGSDRLDLYYAPVATSPIWTLIGTLAPTGSGLQSLSTTYVLPAGSQQAIRGRYRYSGSAAPCGTGSYDDHDDLVFRVGSSDVTTPVVSLTSPAEGASLLAPVTLAASASDAGGIAKVEFYEGATLLGSDLSSPYSLAWSAAAGAHTVVAKAYDLAGNVATSAPITFSVVADVTPPTTTLTAPLDGSIVRTSPQLAATATDNVGVTRVEFYADASLVGTDTTSPYSATWNLSGVAPGAHVLTARAYDAGGNVGTSGPVTVTYAPDTAPPAVAMVTPLEGAVLSGLVTLEATATDDVQMHSVGFLANGSYLGTWKIGGAPWSVGWSTLLWPNGPYQIVAEAADDAGNTARSAPVGVLVANTGAVYARYDSLLRVPRCGEAAAVCDSGKLLDALSMAEPNYPSSNSLSDSPSCMDGTGGYAHSSVASIDALRVSSLNGSVLAPGSTVRVEATVWGGNTDTVYLYAKDGAVREYGLGTGWVYLGAFPLSGSRRTQTVSATHTLGTSALQAVRAVTRWYSTGPSFCGDGEYNENDDLVFPVGLTDTSAPSVWMTAPVDGAQVLGSARIAATAADAVGVVRVEFFNGDILIDQDVTVPYELNWDTSGATPGQHSLTARAYDAAGNVGTSAPVEVMLP